MRTKEFWLDTLERSLKTGAQVIIVAWPTTALLDSGSWQVIGITALGAMGLSLLTSIVGSSIGNPESASMLPASKEP